MNHTLAIIITSLCFMSSYRFLLYVNASYLWIYVYTYLFYFYVIYFFTCLTIHLIC